MLKEVNTILQETKELLEIKDPLDASREEEIQNRIIAMYLSLIKDNESEHADLIEEYNRVIKKASRQGVHKIKKYSIHNIPSPIEREEIKKREDETGNTTEETDTIALSVLEYSKTLKKKTEAFGNMLGISKGILETASGTLRKNVHAIEKGIELLEKKAWYSFGTLDMLWIIFLVIFIFICMYLFIRIC